MGWVVIEVAMGFSCHSMYDLPIRIPAPMNPRQTIRTHKIFADLEIFAEKLHEISKAYGFEGWLLNIENEIEESQVPLVKKLIDLLNTDDSKLIFYDSIVNNGKLAWQNELTSKNVDYFTASDGIFLNYWWTNDHLKRTKEFCENVDRKVSDVYASIDCFARGPCEGEFNCQSAVSRIYTADTNFSIAVFAPGWLFENYFPQNLTAESSKYEKCLEFWQQFTNKPLLDDILHQNIKSLYECQKLITIKILKLSIIQSP